MEIYPKLAVDNNRKIRENLSQSLLNIINFIDKKDLTLYMFKIFGYWWILISDPDNEVGTKSAIQ